MAEEERKYFYLKNILDSTIIPIKTKKVSFGRNEDCTVRINDDFISRLHCDLTKNDDNWTVKNYSPNFILVNEKQITKNTSIAVEPGDLIQVGPTKKYIYKFGSKVFIGGKRHRTADHVDSCAKKGKYSPQQSSSNITANQEEIEFRLRSNEIAHSKLLEDKKCLEEKLEKQKIDLEKRYEDEKKHLEKEYQDGALAQQTMLKENKNLAKKLSEQVKDIQNKLDEEKLKLEDKLKSEETERLKLLDEKVSLANQLKIELEHEKKLKEEKVQLEQQLNIIQDEKSNLRIEIESIQDEVHKKNEELKAIQEKQKLSEEIEKNRLKLEMQLNSVTTELIERDMVNSTLEQELKSRNQEKEELEKQLQLAKEQVTKSEELSKSNSTASTSNFNVREQLVESVTDCMESELQCGVCTELYIRAAVLNCGHTFCEHCINKWKKVNSICPSCRGPITSVNRSITVDNFIDKIIPTLSDELKKRRNELVEERKEEQRRDEAAAAAAAAERQEYRNRGRNRRGRGRGRGYGAPPRYFQPQYNQQNPVHPHPAPFRPIRAYQVQRPLNENIVQVSGANPRPIRGTGTQLLPPIRPIRVVVPPQTTNQQPTTIAPQTANQAPNVRVVHRVTVTASQSNTQVAPQPVVVTAQPRVIQNGVMTQPRVFHNGVPISVIVPQNATLSNANAIQRIIRVVNPHNSGSVATPPNGNAQQPSANGSTNVQNNVIIVSRSSRQAANNIS